MGGIVQTSPDGGGGGGGFPVTAFRFVVSDAAGNASALPEILGSIPYYSDVTGAPAVNNNLQYFETANAFVLGGASPFMSVQSSTGIANIGIFDLSPGGTEALLTMQSNSKLASLVLSPDGSTGLEAANGPLLLGARGFDTRVGDTQNSKYLTVKASSGNVLINTSTDDGINTLQVNGSIKASSVLIPGLTVGGIVFVGAGGALTDVANLAFNSSTNILTVGSGTTTAAGVQMGYSTLSGFGGIWPTGVTPVSTNAAILVGATSIFVAGRSGGSVFLRPTSATGTGVVVDGIASSFNPEVDAAFKLGASTNRFSSAFLGSSTAITASAPAVDVAQTWNNGAVAFTAAKVNVTNSASATGSLLQDWQVGSVSQANIDRSGAFMALGSIAANPSLATGGFFANGGSGAFFGSAVGVKWTSTNAVGTPDAGLNRNAAGVVEANNGTAGTLRDITLRDLFTNDATFLIRTKTTLTNNAAAQIATMTNGPTAGNPTKWFAVDDNGTTRYSPLW